MAFRRKATVGWEPSPYQRPFLPVNEPRSNKWLLPLVIGIAALVLGYLLFQGMRQRAERREMSPPAYEHHTPR